MTILFCPLEYFSKINMNSVFLEGWSWLILYIDQSLHCREGKVLYNVTMWHKGKVTDWIKKPLNKIGEVAALAQERCPFIVRVFVGVCTPLCVWQCVCIHARAALTWARLLVLIECVSFIAVTGEDAGRTHADLLAVMFPLSTQVNSYTVNTHTQNSGVCGCVCVLSTWLLAFYFFTFIQKHFQVFHLQASHLTLWFTEAMMYTQQRHFDIFLRNLFCMILSGQNKISQDCALVFVQYFTSLPHHFITLTINWLIIWNINQPTNLLNINMLICGSIISQIPFLLFFLCQVS